MNTLLCVLFIPLSSPRTVTRDDLLSHSCGSAEDALLHENALPRTPCAPPIGIFLLLDVSQMICGAAAGQCRNHLFVRIIGTDN